ncbi:MAG: hypothetical protein IT460_14060 [Planctomycetes bacterium]|nr:hypothetical protein [Planctomycetota bacterium]
MRSLPLLVALLALGVAVFSLVTSTGFSRELRERDAYEAALEGRLATLETTLAGGPAATAPRPVAGGTDVASGAPGAGPGATGAAPALAGGARPPSPAELERRLAALEARAAETGSVPSSSTPVAVDGLSAFPGRWIGSVDDAVRQLDLSPAQRADFERALADAQRDVDALRKLPDDTGATWEAIEKDVVRMENGALHFDGSRLSAFREKVIPGRNESFGGAMRRIRDDASRRLRDTLSPAQREVFEKSQTGALLPGTDGDGLGLFAVSGTMGVTSIEEALPEPTTVAPVPTGK